jgi:hypothetical protein
MQETNLAHASVDATYKLASAATEMMWACAIATARATVASTARGLELWSQMMRIQAGQPPRPTVAHGHDLAAAGATGAGPAPPPAPSSAPDPASVDVAAPTGELISFASYRSAGGHATAQVTIPDGAEQT